MHPPANVGLVRGSAVERPRGHRHPAVELASAAWKRARWAIVPPWDGFGEPFNGQALRRHTVEQLARLFEPDVLFETGTFLGHTTELLAQWDKPVYTIEAHAGFYRLAQRRLRRFSNVAILYGDSVAGLKHLAASTERGRTLAYLDAHWSRRLPLAEEVRVLFGNWNDLLVVIDDFHVPKHPGYGYDVYDGVALELGLLSLPDGVCASYPKAPPREETGSRRGTVYLGVGETATATLRAAHDRGLLEPVETRVSEGLPAADAK